jgi:hypothetical protein
MKLTKKHQEKIWGESGPYSQVNLKIENRILDDAVSRIFVIVETELNPFTFELIKKNSEKFKNDKMIQGILKNSEYQGIGYGYVSCAYQEELTQEGDSKVNDKTFEIAHKVLAIAQQATIKMHKFTMNFLKEKNDEK